MNIRVLRTLLLCVACFGLTFAHAADPEPGKKYFSLHLTTASTMESAQAAATRAGDLPWLRISKQGKLYVLRAGFWETAAEADQQFRLIRKQFPAAGMFKTQYSAGGFTLVGQENAADAASVTLAKDEHPKTE
ncbi:hypothetical protein KSF73_07305 [Burkholderiaceae bacterium DAT-1]|nr:hypothetical protein [Burkholderiaceae bacterium DAT-1]